MFVDYEYYQNNGGTLTQTLFEKYEKQAEKIVKAKTGGKDLTKFVEPVSQAICDIVEILNDKQQKEDLMLSMLQGNSKVLAGEKVGSYSVTYANPSYNDLKESVSDFEINTKIDDALFLNLYTTGLLYAGMPNVQY